MEIYSQRIMDVKHAESCLPLYTMKEVAHHCEMESCWIIVSDMVYDVTTFVREHPGGDDIVMEHAGSDATVAFVDKGHSPDALGMMKDYLIGQLVQEERRFPNRPVGGT